MKTRNSLVSNSSSTSFIITNKTDKKLTIVDFVKENPQLVEMFNDRYGYKYTQHQMIESAEARIKKPHYKNQEKQYIFEPESRKCCIFGDQQGDIIGHVFDYILRDGGESKNFKWKFNEYLR